MYIRLIQSTLAVRANLPFTSNKSILVINMDDKLAMDGFSGIIVSYKINERQ